MDVIGKFPIYEADQVLSANHLNQSLAYLEKHDRLSRRLLHGIGVVCGLNFSVEEGTLTITKGCGISSEGYLIALEDDLSLTQVRKYIPPYPPKYNPFYAANGSPFTLWEAVPATEAEGDGLQDLTKLNLQDKVLLLYLEMRDKDLKDCIGDDCDNNGTLREFTIRPLIIGITDLVKIFNQDGNSVEDIASAVMGRHYLQQLTPPRFDVIASSISSVSEINDAYTSLADGFVPELRSRLQAFEAFYADAFKMPKTMVASVAKIKEKLEAIKKEELGHQYFFDYLTDLAAAYNELLEVATRWLVACMPDEDDFPRHLALGEFRQIKANQPKIFRNYFKHSPSTPQAHEQLKEVVLLYKRLLKMLASFEIRQEEEVRAIASNYARALSDKAIPYYFRPQSEGDQSWLLGWSFRHRERSSWQNIGHYYNNPANRLLRDLEFHNFFRIEGHLGRSYTDALAEVKENINRYRLPFKAIALSTGSVPFDLNLLDECRIKDIDARYDSAVDDLLCQLQEISCFLGALPIPGAQQASTNRVAAGAAATHKTMESASPAMALNVNATHATLAGIKSMSRVGLVTGSFEKRFVKGQFIATNCNLQQGTLGRFYLDYIQNDEIKGKSLLDLFLPYLNISNYPPATRQLLLGYSYAIIVLDEIEELVSILSGSTVSSLNFRALQAFAEELMAFLKLYITEINKLESEPEFEINVWLHDIKHQMVHLHALCKLKALFSLYEAYRARIKASLEELRFSNFAKKHPGIDHKAGVPKGGTFIMLYHTNEEEEDLQDYRPKDQGVLNTDPKAALENLKAFNPTVKVAAAATHKTASRISVNEANSWMRNNLQEYAKATGKTLNQAMLNQLDAFLGGLQLKQEEQVDLKEGTVVADFYLPYICCSGCGGIEINMTEPQVPISIRLKNNRFCIGDENKEPIIVSPEGGVVTGPGVEEGDGGYVFNPSSEEVDIGTLTLTYTYEGRTAQTNVSVVPRPEADFQVFIDQSRNGTYVSFENISRNANKFLWDFGNGQKSTAKDPETQLYKLDQETAIITLTAGNGVCEDVEVKTVTLISKEYEMRIGKEQTAFCSDEGDQIIDIYIKGIGRENYPYDGVVKGKGVTQPTGVEKPNFIFNPKTAGVGSHKLVYEVDGNAEAELNVTVAQQFASSFQAKAERNSDGLTITFSNISPKDKKSYNWRMDEKNPTNVVPKTNANNFSHYYSPNEIGDRKEITVELQINDSPCVSRFSRTIDIPAEPQRNVVTSFDATTLRDSYTVKATTVNTLSSNVNISTRAVASTNPFTQGQQLLKGIADSLKNQAQSKKLLAGSMNAQLAKAFETVITGIQDSYTKNRRTLKVTQRNAIMAFYGQVIEGLINLVGMLNKDLKATEALAKAFKLAGDSTAAMAKLGMPASVKNGIKNRLNALIGLNKPVAVKAAKAFLEKL